MVDSKKKPRRGKGKGGGSRYAHSFPSTVASSGNNAPNTPSEPFFAPSSPAMDTTVTAAAEAAPFSGGTKNRLSAPAAALSPTISSGPLRPYSPTYVASCSEEDNTDLVLTGDRKRGLYECDYCRSDISQVPRIRCAVCPEFDLCLDCFATTDPSAANTTQTAASAAIARNDEFHSDGSRKEEDGGVLSGAAASHDHTHGYRVADSTRYPLFPPLRGVLTNSSSAGEEGCNGSGMDDDVDKSITFSAGGKDGKTVAHSDDDSEDQKETKKARRGTNEETIAAKALADSTTLGRETKADDEFRTKHDQEDGGDELDAIIVVEDTRNFWTVEEDLRLLDAIATFGLGNWADISEAVSGNSSLVSSTKSAKRCMERYVDDFLGRYGYILPPYTLVPIENEEDDNVAIATGENATVVSPDANLDSGNIGMGRKRKRHDKTLPVPMTTSQVSFGKLASSVKGGFKNKKYRVVPTSTLPGYDELWPDPYIPPLSGLKVGDDVGRDRAYRAELLFVKAINLVASKDEADKLRKEWMDTRLNQADGPRVLPTRLEDIRLLPGSELAGYMPRRGDFDIEWENEAEAIMADMEFSPADLPQDRALKLQIIEIYNSKLDEREKRKKLLVDWNLIDYRKNQAADQLLPRDERDLINRMRLFARFHSPEEHEKFVKDLLKAKRLRKEIAQLQMYRRMGITSLAEAEKYELDKNRREEHKREYLKEVSKTEDAAKKAAAAEADGALTSSMLGGATSSDLWRHYSSDRKKRRSLNRVGSGDGTNAVQEEVSERVATEQHLTINNFRSEASTAVDTENFESPIDEETSNEKFESTAIQQRSQKKSSQEPAFNIQNMPGYELLTLKEIGLCQRLQLKPKYYLEAKNALIKESLNQGLLCIEGSDSSRQSVSIVDVEKRDGVIDFVLRPGWISSKPHHDLPSPDTL